MRVVHEKMTIYCSVFLIAMFANAAPPVYTLDPAVRLETMMDGDDFVIKCLIPEDVYTGLFKIDWMIMSNHGIITTCRPTRPCLPPSIKIDAHKFEVIPGGAKLQIIDFKNRTEDRKFTCGFYNGSEYSTEITFSVQSSYNIFKAGDGDNSKSELQGKSTTLTTNGILTSQGPEIETTQYTNEVVDNVCPNNIIPLIILGVLLATSVTINIAAFIHWRCKLRNKDLLKKDGGEEMPSKVSSNTKEQQEEVPRQDKSLAKDGEAKQGEGVIHQPNIKPSEKAKEEKEKMRAQRANTDIAKSPEKTKTFEEPRTSLTTETEMNEEINSVEANKSKDDDDKLSLDSNYQNSADDDIPDAVNSPKQEMPVSVDTNDQEDHVKAPLLSS